MSEQKIYHVCNTVNEDDTRILIDFEAGHRCVLPTNDPLWKRPQDVTNKVGTKWGKCMKRQASNKDIKNYFKNINESNNNQTTN